MSKEIVNIDGQKVALSNLDKIFWPEEKITKGDLIFYYLSIADYILPHLKNRPESLRRYPSGVNGQSFFQKNFSEAPKWVKQERVLMESEAINFIFCQDRASLAYIINLGCIDLNPWLSSTPSLDNPDYLVIDLDPFEIDFDAVIETALATKQVCDRLNLKCYPKTSGATGMHIFLPLADQYTYDQAKSFAEILANLIHNQIPEITSIERIPAARKGKVYIDFLQNFRGQTIASVYSVRPHPGAPVSTPLVWEEVKRGIRPRDYNIFNTKKRLEKTGDIFLEVLTETNDIQKALQDINR